MPRSLGNRRQPNLLFALVKDSLPWRSEAVKPIIAKARKTNDGRWSRSGSTRDLPTIAFFRAGTLLRRNGPVPGILAAHRPGAIMESVRRFVVRLGQGATRTPSVKANTNIFS